MNNKKPRLLILASIFYPQKKGGGPAVSIYNLVNSICKDFDITVISKNYEKGEKTSLKSVCSGKNDFFFGSAYYLDYGKYTYKNLKKIISETNPDIIYVNSFFSYPDLAVALAFSKKAKLIIAPRGELLKEALSNKSFKKRIYLCAAKLSKRLKNASFHVSSLQEEQEVSKLFKNTVFNIPNISCLSASSAPVCKSAGSLNLFYSARIVKHKNLLLALDVLRKTDRNISFDIYGAQEDLNYLEKCKQICAVLPPNVKVRFMGPLSHDEMLSAIPNYHALFLPTQSENFGHSIIETLACSRPVITSTTTPWHDLENHFCGFAKSPDDADGFLHAVNTLADMEEAEFNKMCENSRNYALGKLNTDSVINSYINMFKNEVLQ